MSIHKLSTETERFVDRVVAHHGFSNAAEWAHGLEDLADMPDDEIDGLFGVTPAMARADRELFDRIVGETEKSD